MTMFWPHILLLFLVLVLVLDHVAISFADDGVVMSDLLQGISPAPSGWDSRKPYCQWNNVKCDTSGNVISIDLSSKSLSGTLPDDLNKLASLQTFLVQRNSLSGSMPSFANMTSLKEIDMAFNSFDSVPKDFLLGLTSLQKVSLNNNTNLAAWELPTYIAESYNLQEFVVSACNVVGSMPDVFDKLPSLQSLRLSFNSLTGPLPLSMANSGLQNLWLNNQEKGLSGPISVLSSMKQLSQVWLHLNAFTGGIPDLSNCTNLFDLQLRNNMLTGPVPPSLLNMPKLVNVTLQNNKFQGEIPQFRNGVQVTLGTTNNFCSPSPGPCDAQVTILIEIAGGFGYPMTLAESWGGNDVCRGWKSITCDSQGKNVSIVNLAKQGMSGNISPSFSKLVSLKTLVLSDNVITGEIPQSLTTLSQLQLFDVSNNNLSGPIPAFPASVKFSYGGNTFIGKNVTTADAGGSAKSSSSGSTGSNGSSISGGMIAIIVISILVIIIVMAFVSYRWWFRRNPKRFAKVGFEEGSGISKNNVYSMENGYVGDPNDFQSQRNSDMSEMPQNLDGGNIVISIQVLRQATSNFSENNVLGKGGFGVVYKGIMHDGTELAVKRMESGLMGNKGLSEFQAEISVLTKVRHRHLVALLGYCVNGHERLLVYEYMPQGTLSQHLFEQEELGFLPLTWKQRLAIALDVARGVEYLHGLAQQSFIHRDLKPSNVLLDDDMRAKVADFGLVKNAPDGNKYSIETKLAGTFGYLAPEYAATGRVTTKVDVYAFGVILMEIITSRKALDETVPDSRSHLVTWFRKVIVNKENLGKEIDPSIDLDGETYASICKVAELAGHCTAREANQRPDMGHAVNVLAPLVQQWKPTSYDEEENYDIEPDMTLPQALQKWQADEDTSRLFDDSYTQSDSTLPSKPSGSTSTFNSSNFR
ncbi:hypothetical protein Leryth_019073 [Lithospermum erythrorhizon]|uniref:non-specific serine/threonine protein kinase n=1 Tax=Lithospermum erythrorhizon TaxID=34254 RepID=A0AAV3QSP3_LITER|nr:hypothetical protein Leryth_019073 [Lithospermum erythrorhizon]